MKLTQRINFEPIRISKDEKKQGGGQTFLVAYILMFALYMTIIIYGTSVMRSVTEEKSSRVVEVLLSSLKPFELMAGKILGVSLVGLTQYFIWAIFAISIFSFGQIILGSFLKSSFNISSIPFISPTIFVYFILFFILGYLLYSGLYAAVGAIVDNESEARSYNFIILMPLILPILIMTYIVGNPESLFSIILSIIPFTSPIIMLLRICVSSVPAFEILISVIVMILTIIAEIWVVSKIYRVGILMYGKKPDIREILKWIRYS
jgi:ABC-2 type transport system permease protein